MVGLVRGSFTKFISKMNRAYASSIQRIRSCICTHHGESFFEQSNACSVWNPVCQTLQWLLRRIFSISVVRHQAYGEALPSGGWAGLLDGTCKLAEAAVGALIYPQSEQLLDVIPYS